MAVLLPCLIGSLKIGFLSGVLSDCFSDHNASGKLKYRVHFILILSFYKIKIQNTEYKYITIWQCKNMNVLQISTNLKPLIQFSFQIYIELSI